VDNGTLPSVAFVKLDGLLDGRPASSKLDLFEGIVKKIMDRLSANPELFASTALFITMDEGGGFYDSGYIQPLDFFGDGPRIPLIVVSPYSRGGHISHSYADHVSILKFIERNWSLRPLSSRSHDKFPNPRSDRDNPYVPKNSAAIGICSICSTSGTTRTEEESNFHLETGEDGARAAPLLFGRVLASARFAARGSRMPPTVAATATAFRPISALLVAPHRCHPGIPGGVLDEATR
jgi:hypothetical protein